MKTAPPTVKPAVSKQIEIAAVLRRQIVLGSHAPGSKLPTWDELERQFRVSRPTLRLALGDLKAQGFIEPDSTRGTFVAQRPPHRHRYGLIFHESPENIGWNRLYAALAHQAAVLSNTTDRKIEIFTKVAFTESNEGAQANSC